MSDNPGSTDASRHSLAEEAKAFWCSFPFRWVVLSLFCAWIALFCWWGNSTLGYVDTKSLFGWWFWVNSRLAIGPDGSLQVLKLFDGEEAHAWFIPFVVLALLWWRRDEIISLPKQICWPAVGILLAGILLHVAGYMVQQARVSLVGFFVGLYGVTGLFWGVRWLRLALFPFALFAFCVPLGSSGEMITFPMRLMATKITGFVCQTLLGIDVIQDGTQLFDSGRAYQYEVAAACSGLRSVTAIVAFGVIYGYISFQSLWRRSAAALAAFPLAILANVFRLTLIVIAAEAFGQDAGNYVHENTWFSLAPYVPAIAGMLGLGWLLRENRRPRDPAPAVMLSTAEQKL